MGHGRVRVVVLAAVGVGVDSARVSLGTTWMSRCSALAAIAGHHDTHAGIDADLTGMEQSMSYNQPLVSAAGRRGS
jgi:hypothetical protein